MPFVPDTFSGSKLWDQDDDLLDPFDDLLDDILLTINHPTKVWNGLLIPYSVTVFLFFDSNGYLAGAVGSSGEAATDVYQEVIGLAVGTGEYFTTTTLHLP